MSYPAISNIQYRLKEENGVTKMRFVHRAMGQIPHDTRVEEGWGDLLRRIRRGVESRVSAKR
jgi:hypothetical protein